MAVGSLLLTALTGKAPRLRPRPGQGRGGFPRGAERSGGRSCRGGKEGLTGFRRGGRGREKGRGGEDGGTAAGPSPDQAWRERGEQSQAWLSGRPAAATALG